MFQSIVEAVAYYGNTQPEKLCIADEITKNSYADVWTKVKQISYKLCELGVKKSDYVLVECTQDAKYLICDLACQLIGAIFVPLENKVAHSRLEEIIHDTESRILISNQVHNVEILQINTDKLFESADSEGILTEVCFPSKEQVAQILYTTGTTGKSKGIVITHGNNIALAENIMFGTEMKKESVELIPLPLSHSHGLRSCYGNFLNGSSVVVFDGVMKVKQIFELITQYQVTALDLSPSAAKVLLKLSKGNLNQYREQIDFVQLGTAALGEDVKEELCNIFPQSRLYNFYGSTEAGRSCVLDFNREKGKVGCIGKPAKNATFIVVDEEMNPMKSGEENPGLLAISGDMNMKEYLKEKELTEAVLKDGFVYTNDRGYIDAEGNIFVLGRMDDVINYKGIKISPEEIEEVVNRNPEIYECACVAMDDEMCGQVPRLFLVVKDKNIFDIKKFMNDLKEQIEPNKMPKKVQVIDELPKSSNGKILRRKLRTMK